MNGDGFDDLIIGAEGADPTGNTNAGASYVVFGQGGGLPDCPVLTRAGTQDGSLSADQTLTGPDTANTFLFDVRAVSGDDRITNFQKVDVLATTTQKLADTNGDGFITFGRNGVLDLDGADAGQDTVTLDGIDPRKGLRSLGESCADVFIYADATVRPTGAKESTVADDTLAGDVGDAQSQVFFFDTALGIGLGSDEVDNFGNKDLLVTTTKVFDSDNNNVINFADNDVLDLPNAAGTVAINSKALTDLEFDGSVAKNGVEYFVYSGVGTTGIDTGDLLVA